MFGVDERVIGNARPYIGVLAQGFPSGYIQTLKPAALRGGNRGFQKDFGSQERIPGTRFDPGAIAAQVNLFANLDGLYIQSRAGRVQDLERGVHDLGADAVAVSNGDGCFGGHSEYPNL